jgi:hypothetical protein
MKPDESNAFVEHHGIVLEGARGSAPSLAEEIVGGVVRGSWWGHPKGREIFAATQVIGKNPDVLVCKLIDGKVTYIHRRLWPALVKLASRFKKDQLARTWHEHTEHGAHETKRIPFPDWVPPEIIKEAERLSLAEAERALSTVLSQ